jgi:NAD(P)-dependent dehydrogenase (short-subunit alcohol dehydrogenase family)
VLVNNAGIFNPHPFEEIPDAEWLRFFETNVMSGVRLSRHYAAGMRARRWGRIVFVSSESGLQIPAEMVPPAAVKALRAVIAAEVALLPVGGIGTHNMAHYRAAGASGFGIGAALFKPGLDPAQVGASARDFAAAWNGTIRA